MAIHPKFLHLCFVTAFISCSSGNANQNSTEQGAFDSKKIMIDTLTLNGYTIKDIFLVVDTAVYPQIKGLPDKNFENQVNEQWKGNLYSYIEHSKKQYGMKLTKQDTVDEPMITIPSAVASDFEILTQTDSIISIVQKMYVTLGHGGNGWEDTSMVSTIDVSKNSVLSNSDLSNGIAVDLINTQVNKFFKHLYPDFNPSECMMCPNAKTQTDLMKLHYGIRNDSIVLVTEAEPSAHFTYHTYVIPIKKRH